MANRAIHPFIATMPSPPSSPPTARRQTSSSPPRQQQEKESSLSRFVIAPITFFSFLLSLFLIDSYTTTSRHRNRAPGQNGGWLSALLWKPKPGSPYAYVGGSRGKGKWGAGRGGEGEEWVWHTKQRKMLRMEVVDAFELRRWVVTALGVVVVVFGGGGLWIGRWVWRWWGW